MSDIEDIEECVIKALPDDSKVKTPWLLCKNKFARIEEEIKKKMEEIKQEAESSIELTPGSSTNMTFHARAPHLFSTREMEAIFTFAYQSKDPPEISRVSHRQLIKISSSPYAVTGGAFIGSLMGFLIRKTYLSSDVVWFGVEFWKDLIASVMLGLLFAFLVRKSPTSKKPITAEDFGGGLIVGAFAGMFTRKVINWFSTLIKI